MKIEQSYFKINFFITWIFVLLILFSFSCSNKKEKLADEYNHKSVIANNKKNYIKAIDFSSKAISLYKKKDKYYFNRGFAYLNTGDYQSSIDDFTKSIELFKSSKEFLIKRYKTMLEQRARAYHKAEKESLAIIDFNEYILIDSLNADIYFYRAISFSLIDSFSQSKQDYDTALRLNYSKKDIYGFRAPVLFFLAEYEKALDDLNAALAYKDALPKNAFLLFGRGATLVELEMYRKAKVDIENYIQYKSQDAVAHLLLAVVHYKLDNLVLANNYFSKADSLKTPKDKNWDLFDSFIYYSTNIKSILKEWGKI